MPKPSTTGSVYIEALSEDVYDFALGDLDSLPDWMTSVDTIEEVDPDWPAPGSSHVYSRILQKRTIRGKTTVVEADRPRRVVMREETLDDGTGRQPQNGERSGQTIWEFVPEDIGTRVTMRLVGAELSGLWYFIWTRMFSARVIANLERSLANLKQICEEELEDVPEEASDSAAEAIDPAAPAASLSAVDPDSDEAEERE